MDAQPSAAHKSVTLPNPVPDDVLVAQSGEACRSGKSFYLYRPISDRHGSGFHLGEVRFGRGTASCFPPEAGTVRRKVPR